MPIPVVPVDHPTIIMFYFNKTNMDDNQLLALFLCSDISAEKAKKGETQRLKFGPRMERHVWLQSLQREIKMISP